MENPMAAQVHYGEYQRQATWINGNDWQFEQPAKRHPARATVAKALIALAMAVTPTTQREAGTA
jgi:hypothetical protein